MKLSPCLIISLAATLVPWSSSRADDQSEAKQLLRKVVQFHREKVGHEGAYLWRYSADLRKQEGEGKATKTSGWTQPPGTPSVGEAYLTAWKLSSERICRDAAIECAHALVRSQLQSGGWDSHFDLGPDGVKRYAYRVAGERGGKRNSTTFDDNKSQSALMLLMHMDEELGFKDEKIHETVEYALKQMLAAQYPNGAWPQQYSEPPDATKHPVRKASYPPTWSRTFPKQRYTGYYTLNDNNMSYIAEMLFEANRIYGRRDCYEAALKTGNFFLLAQMPEPQPGWAQQYDSNMHPAWARKFEPPAVTGGESQQVMKSLINLYRHTGEKRFVEPLPRALAYYRSCVLPDGKLARFYELKANKPLYFTKDYQLTYSDADMPTHYSFKVGNGLDSIEKAYRKAIDSPAETLKPTRRSVKVAKLSSNIIRRGKEVMKALDSRGAWVEKGSLKYHGEKDDTKQIIDCRTFIKNLQVLAEFAGAKK